APVHAPRAPLAKDGKEGSMSADAVPRFFPNFTKECGSTQFVDIMHDQLSPALSRVSDALFHSSAPDEDRMNEVAEASAIILGCAKRLDQVRPAKLEGIEEITFEHFLIQLVMNTHALQTSALEDDEQIVVHWYHHVKQTCAACHSRFRE